MSGLDGASAGAGEAERLAGAAGDRYDRVVRLAQAIFAVPIVALNLVGPDGQVTVAAVGPYRQRLPLDASVCASAMWNESVVEIADLRTHERFRDYPMVAGEPRVRFYAGVPLRSTSGQRVGVLCLLDLVPRELGAAQREMLADLGVMIERELAAQDEMMRAGEVQQLLLPSEPPALAGVEVAGRVQPARETGGDFYDWQVVGEPPAAQLQVVLADVMGKGLPAALIASEVRAVLRTHSRYAALDEAVRRTSETTLPDLDTNERFVTLWGARLDPVDGTLHYVDAGHGLAALVSERGARRLAQAHLPLGLPVPDTWTQESTIMAPDETLVVVSDGVLDVVGGIDVGLEAVREPAVEGASCADVVERIVGFAADRGAEDDVTAVVVRRTTGRAAGRAATAG
ncbi:protein serine phosphatase with GAF(s) sensor(s) [Xylanimonas cellulosilytica DSM 15894]|uniref:Protein serine phosphatase with GAF(S) sensor(S) n=1 Tax=Xylanimonas cellulosilytica (strain DSM 15894 / JCM 12276 / CECT 5975 / KCTC 9989 / LMG 20990 / NBRC 107835 / XIL07) TaxID=446471 RepID=D1BXX1_XYLCX|nr:SpoIIE family protein phosphatase [Xylanimonas cellulosilytica]ACZ31762.1 protein serine phosphatase with GAF(s) sensor(s) [Xylanimonas cellulosilytica DSM 15894]